MLIASQLRRKDLHWKNWTPIDNSLSITLAYQIIRQLKEQGYVLYEIGFTDRKGNFKRRIVLMDWNARHQVKGTGRPTKPGQRLFCDVARIAAGVPDTISAYQDKIDYIIKAE